MDKKQVFSIIRKVLLTAALIGNIVFIFYHSSQIGDVSAGFSRQVLEWANSLLARLGSSRTLSHTFIRKLGHFSEYTLLGFWLMMALRVYSRRVIAHVSWPLFLGLLVAVCDEFYQTFIPGRTGAVTDVVIDFAGVCTGLGFAMVIVLIFHGIARLARGGPVPAR